jgi:hypothetical protein
MFYTVTCGAAVPGTYYLRRSTVLSAIRIYIPLARCYAKDELSLLFFQIKDIFCDPATGTYRNVLVRIQIYESVPIKLQIRTRFRIRNLVLSSMALNVPKICFFINFAGTHVLQFRR